MTDDAADRRFIIEKGSVVPIGKIKQTIDHTSEADKKAKAEAERAQQIDVDE
jgi:hypothetical protein